MNLYGEHPSNVDAKGRVCLSKDFGELHYLGIAVCSDPAFEDSRHLTLFQSPPKNTELHPVRIDALRRVLLNNEMRDYIGIRKGGEVVVAGVINRIEIWNPETRERYLAYLDEHQHEYLVAHPL